MNPRPDLILTVDNGVSSAAPIARAAAMGIDTVVTDHHLPGPELPKCAAIVNPNLPDSAFPSKALAGVGVMYYVLLTPEPSFASAASTTRRRSRGSINWSTSVALGTVADVVRLDKNNRILVAQGLKRIRQGRTHPGILALFSVARRDATGSERRRLRLRRGPAHQRGRALGLHGNRDRMPLRTTPSAPTTSPTASTTRTRSGAHSKPRCRRRPWPRSPGRTSSKRPRSRSTTRASTKAWWAWSPRASARRPTVRSSPSRPPSPGTSRGPGAAFRGAPQGCDRPRR